LVIARQRDPPLRTLDVRVVLVVAALLDQLPPRTALAADVHERALLAHDARKTVGVVAEARGVAREERRVLDESLERVGIFAAVVPREDAALRHDRARRLVVQEEMDEIDAVAHPLIRDAARELAIQAELEIQLRVERPIGLGHQPLLPIGVRFSNLLHLGTTAPAWSVVVPDDLVLAHVAERAAPDDIMSGELVRLTSVLRADLNDGLALLDGITRGFHFAQDIAHGLFAVGVLAGLDG